MKLTLITLGGILVAILWGTLMTFAFPPPWSTVFSGIGGWVFGWYVIAPIILPIIFGNNK